MKLAIITNKYPKVDDYYRNGFIHQRNLEYYELGYKCKVFIVRENAVKNTYVYEGIEVIEGDYDFIKEAITSWGPARILIHFIGEKHMRLLEELNYSIPAVIWIHGVEALKWTRRLFNIKEISFLKYIFVNEKKLKSMKRFIMKSKNIHFILISNWMKEIMETDVGIKIEKYEIIPNVINTELFNYQPKEMDQRKKILIIRNFNSQKYANDLSIKAILELKGKDYFKDLKFCIYGQGKHFETLTNKLRDLDNVEIHNKFLSQAEIAIVHKDYGIFLCPTRQDSQGVSMCEAMSSGLVPVTSNNTAIPEFVDKDAGYLTDNKPKSIAKAIEDLYFSKEQFAKKSYNSHKLMFKKCNKNKIINEELSYINGLQD